MSADSGSPLDDRGSFKGSSLPFPPSPLPPPSWPDSRPRRLKSRPVTAQPARISAHRKDRADPSAAPPPTLRPGSRAESGAIPSAQSSAARGSHMGRRRTLRGFHPTRAKGALPGTAPGQGSVTGEPPPLGRGRGSCLPDPGRPVGGQVRRAGSPALSAHRWLRGASVLRAFALGKAPATSGGEPLLLPAASPPGNPPRSRPEPPGTVNH